MWNQSSARPPNMDDVGDEVWNPQDQDSQEAGATVRCNTKFRDMNVHVPAQDERAIEVLASLPLHHGAQLVVDITLRSALTAQGRACPNASQVNGEVLMRAREDNEAKYHELLSSERCRLVVVAIEFVTSLAGSRGRDAPPPLRESAFHCCKCLSRGPLRLCDFVGLFQGRDS